MGRYYILVDGVPLDVPTDTREELLAWARWWEKTENRVIRRTEIEWVCVSTIFLGLNHNFIDKDPPILFETMVFGDPDRPGDEFESERYCTLADAIAGHERACELVRRMIAESEKIVTSAASDRANHK